jgi:chemotaxis signal transduction protein
MVSLVKARQKAKKEKRQPTTDNPAAPQPQTDRLQKFKEQAGRRREQVVVAPAEAKDELHLLTFTIDGEQYAIDVERVQEIATPRALTPVPNADPFILGVMSLRGTVVTVVDVRGRLRHPPNGAGRQVVVITAQGGPLGFTVDRVLRPLKIDRAAIEPHPVVHASEERPSIRGVFRRVSALTIVLDLDKLLA